MAKIQASVAMLKVLKAWGVENIYGLPGGSFDSTMNALWIMRNELTYVGVKHEEVGAIAAVAEGKATGKIGVTFGSAGPGAIHLLNGLYDAKVDNIPTLAIIAQVPSSHMNTDYFQEFDQKPWFDDVSVYNRIVMTAEQLPMVIDTAIRTAYAKRGVATVIIPKDFGWADIEDTYTPSAGAYAETPLSYAIRPEDVQRTLDLLAEAERPIIYYGKGARSAAKELEQLSDTLAIPLVSSYLGRGAIDVEHPDYMGSTGRVATKPGVDAAIEADVILFLGSNYEFGRHMFAPTARFIDVNTNPMDIGHRHSVELGVRADAAAFLAALVRAAAGRENGDHTSWREANRENKAQWRGWIEGKAKNDTDRTPLRFEPVFAAINNAVNDDAVFSFDVGNINIASARFLHLKPTHLWTTSPLYATMGYGLPASIATALRFPDRQQWNLAGDGAMAMVGPDLRTQADHHLPVINMVFSNSSLGFIEAEQDDTHQPHSGVILSDIDWATFAQSLGVKGYTIRTIAELTDVLEQVKNTTEPVLLDLKMTDDRQIPVEKYAMHRTGMEDIEEFNATYESHNLEEFKDIAARHGITLP